MVFTRPRWHLINPYSAPGKTEPSCNGEAPRNSRVATLGVFFASTTVGCLAGGLIGYWMSDSPLGWINGLIVGGTFIGFVSVMTLAMQQMERSRLFLSSLDQDTGSVQIQHLKQPSNGSVDDEVSASL